MASKIRSCEWSKATRNVGEVAILAVYVDDLILMTKSTTEMAALKASLEAKLKMKDLGKLHYCLGINFVHDEKQQCLWLSQKQYILKLLEKYGLIEAKVTSTPADLSVKLKEDDGVSKPVDRRNYQSIVGSLLYAAVTTRPDIAYAVGAVSRFNSKPTEAHLTAAKRVLRYLKGTADFALKYQKSQNGDLIGYSDSDWAGNVDDRHSINGNVFLMTKRSS